MAIALDANLGSNDANGSAISLTTTGTAAAGTRIFVLVSFWNTNTAAIITTVSDGSAYALEASGDSGSDRFEIWSRNAASGLSSGSTITATLTNFTGVGGMLIGAVSFSGLGSVDTTASSSGGIGTGWTSGTATNTNPDALFLGGAGNETATTCTSTPTNGIEIHDRWRTTDQQGFATGYTIAASSAARNINGTFTVSSTVNTGALVIYSAAAAPSAPDVVTNVRRLMRARR